jgi:hypothetical protein
MSALKRRGLKPGVSDLVLPLPRGGFHGLYLELKFNDKSVVAPEQWSWKNLMTALGYCANIAFGFEAAKKAIEDYVNV